MLILSLLTKLKNKYKNLEFEDSFEKFYTVTNNIINVTENRVEVEKMVLDTCYNRLQVIDLICYNHLDKILERNCDLTMK